MGIYSHEMEVVDRVVGNLEPLGGTLRDINGLILDLTGKSIFFRMVSLSGTVKVDSYTCIVTDAEAGKVTYNPIAGHMNTAGKYAMYFVDSENPARRWPYDGATWILNLKEENK